MGKKCICNNLAEMYMPSVRTQAAIPPLGDLESPKTQDGTSTELPQSHEEQRTENFIPDGVVLLPTVEVDRRWGLNVEAVRLSNEMH